jgi:hypothetical protein
MTVYDGVCQGVRIPDDSHLHKSYPVAFQLELFHSISTSSSEVCSLCHSESVTGTGTASGTGSLWQADGRLSVPHLESPPPG